MQIQVSTDDNIDGRGALGRQVKQAVRATFEHVSKQITRVEIHLGEGNAAKSGGRAKRCLMEVRPAGYQPVAVSHPAATLPEACGEAAIKLKVLLDTTFGRSNDAEGAASIRENDLR